MQKLYEELFFLYASKNPLSFYPLAYKKIHAMMPLRVLPEIFMCVSRAKNDAGKNCNTALSWFLIYEHHESKWEKQNKSGGPKIFLPTMNFTLNLFDTPSYSDQPIEWHFNNNKTLGWYKKSSWGVSEKMFIFSVMICKQ